MIYPWLNLIVAMTQHEQGIGLYNSLPWPRITEDMLSFKRLTSNCSVITGSGTFRSLNCKPLGDRNNIVLTSKTFPDLITRPQNLKFANNAVRVLSLIEIHKKLTDGNAWVIGGSQVYREFLPYVNKMHITLVKQKFYCDRFFPLVDKSIWQLESTEPGESKEIPVEFQVWSRKYEQ